MLVTEWMNKHESNCMFFLLVTYFELLQVDRYVQLSGVDCMLLPDGCRRLIFILGDDDWQVKVLEDDDDPVLQTLKK